MENTETDQQWHDDFLTLFNKYHQDITPSVPDMIGYLVKDIWMALNPAISYGDRITRHLKRECDRMQADHEEVVNLFNKSANPEARKAEVIHRLRRYGRRGGILEFIASRFNPRCSKRQSALAFADSLGSIDVGNTRK